MTSLCPSLPSAGIANKSQHIWFLATFLSTTSCCLKAEIGNLGQCWDCMYGADAAHGAYDMLTWQVKSRQPPTLGDCYHISVARGFWLVLWDCSAVWKAHVVFAQLPPTKMIILSVPCAGGQEDR